MRRMRWFLPVVSLLVVLGLVTTRGDARLVSFFQNTDAYLKGSGAIVVAKCVAPVKTNLLLEGLEHYDVEVVLVLKGDQKPGKLRVAAPPLQVGQTYLLANSGGGGGGVEFVAGNELCAVLLPPDAPLGTIKGLETKSAVQKLMAFRLNEVEQRLAPLLREQAALQGALQDRTDDLFDSKGNVHIGDILETSTQGEGSALRLQIGSQKIWWSGGKAGEWGYVYFTDKDLPFWEYSISSNTEFSQFEGKPLKARFVGYRSPGTQGNSLTVKVGQMILARTTEAPDVVYVIKFDSLGKPEETATVHYAKVAQGKGR